MKVSELRKILENSQGIDREYLDEEVTVLIDEPSIGGRAMVSIESVSFGFDWEHGKCMLRPKVSLARLKKEEPLWQSAHDFIYTLAQQRTPKGNPTTFAKRAQAILDRAKLRLRE